MRLRPELVDLGQLSPSDEVHLGVLGEDPLTTATAGYGQEILAQFLQIVRGQLVLSNIPEMTATDPMHAYYSARAPYMAPGLGIEPTGQLLEIIAELTAQARDRTVLEIACGTGYWTRHVGPVSIATTATDFSGAMLGIARSQSIANARFLLEDAYSLTGVGDARFDFGFAMHWLSHVPLARWPEFFTAFHARLKPGAKVLLADDIRRPDDGDPYYCKIGARDTFEIRRLPNGESYEIVKNYFTPDELRARLQPFAENLQIRYERPRWWLTYEVRRVERLQS
jgi:SAM-dependent methyltransferase